MLVEVGMEKGRYLCMRKYLPAEVVHEKHGLLYVPGVTKNIKEVMYIHVSDPSLNRNLGKYQLPHILDEVL